MKKNGLGAFVSTSKKTMIIWKLFFLVFWHPQEVPDLAKSSQNVVMVCKNEGTTFSRKTAFSYNNQPKMASLWIPQDPSKIEKVLEKTFPKPTSKKHEKKGTRMKKKSSFVTQGNPPPPPPLPPTPAEPPRRTPRAESQLKLWSLC